jgi:hypothetical protein
MHNVCTILRCNSTGGGAAGRAATHRGPRALHILAEAHLGQAGSRWRSPMTQGCAIIRPFGPEPLPLECRAPAVLPFQGIGGYCCCCLLSAACCLLDRLRAAGLPLPRVRPPAELG